MDNIDWANINTFKKSERLTKENQGEEDDENEDEEKIEEEEEDENAEEEDNPSGQNEMLRKILDTLRPGETILKAIKRLGNSASKGGASASTSGLSASQRWLKKKNNPVTTATAASSSTAAEKETLEKLTGYCNYFIDRGFYDIYEQTYESIEEKIAGGGGEKKVEKSADADFDIFADDVNEDALKQASSSNPTTSGSNKEILQGKLRVLLLI